MKQPLHKLRLAVVGSRKFPRLDLIPVALDGFGPCVVVSGGARGVDRRAENAARERGWPTEIILPQWGQLGRSAGIQRNAQIVDRSDGILIFWDGGSPGTKHVLGLARLHKKPLILIQVTAGSLVTVTTENWECNH